MPIQIDTAELAGLVVGGVLYGIFLCLFCVCGYDLVRRRARHHSQLSWPMVTAGVLLILLATARFSVDTANIFVAFIGHDPRPERIVYLGDVTQPLFNTKHSILIAVLLVGDSFVNYRCWIVWGKSIWVVILPVCMSIASASAGSYTMWTHSHLPNEAILTEAKWLKAFFALSLVANAIATSLLAYRIWSVHRQMKDVMPGVVETSESRLMPVVRIMLESGIINVAYLFAYLITLEVHSQGLEIMSEMATPLTGIIFSIVILRVGHQRHSDEYYTQHRMTTIVFARKSDDPSGMAETTTTTTTAGGVPSDLEVYEANHSSSKMGIQNEHELEARTESRIRDC